MIEPQTRIGVEKPETGPVNLFELVGVAAKHHVVDKPLETVVCVASPLEAPRGFLKDFEEAFLILRVLKAIDLDGLLLHFHP